MLRHAQLWLPGCLTTRRTLRPTQGRPLEILFCVADHYEPNVGGADLPRQRERVERWVQGYPALARRHRDAGGRTPRHTFFYPAEAYDPSLVERLASLCRSCPCRRRMRRGGRAR